MKVVNTVYDISISPERQYVIVCNKHSGNWAGCVLFWGSLTEDHEKRSFGGYTTGVDRCERYTMDEILSFSSDMFTEYRPGMTWQEFRACENVIIQPACLEDLGLSTMKIWYRP